MTENFKRLLVETAAAPYRRAGYFAWHFARGKLRADPVFMALFERHLLPERARLLDLGCGQGLLASLLLAAHSLRASGLWPQCWTPPPRLDALRGIELMAADVARARTALAERAEIVEGDIRRTDFGIADAIVVLDVLHYMTYADQETVLRRIRNALTPRGVLLLRVGDAEGGLPFLISLWVDRLVTFLRGHRLPSLYCRPLRVWRRLLEELGFSVEAIPMSEGTPFANVLLAARHEGSHSA
ncbi:class I SAM-dependent methyltransferase [Methylococcus geothermalis]|uniref:Methyltransferase domain-containing protein n=1 Tax=Methylococcus geothermalis TaxID=2681310 RepID=A0A858QAV3_9GAMM|nr:class I SAM-dependent methyltransferase [Methylococcus geothermalis]QJD30834.1 methyltransferase domain-containing protein [Methylococcus geothermalis]